MKISDIFLILTTTAFWTGIFSALLFAPKLNLFNPKKSITICTWPLIFDPGYLHKFEQETGIKLRITYFETNEELYGKVKATGGAGYDILVPTDYMVSRLKDEGYLKPLDHTKLPFLEQLDERLRTTYYDPDNQYSLGYFWGIYGVAINTNFFQELPEPSWKLLFEPEEKHAPIAMTDAPREAVLLAAKYLFGNIDELRKKENQQKVKELLKKQKSNVLLYNETRTEDLLLGNSCSTVAALSPEVKKVILHQQVNNIKFLVPKEGSFIFIDSFVITQASDKDDLIYQFLNFMYQPEVIQHHLRTFGSCSPLTTTTTDSKEIFCSTQPDNLDFFREIIPPKTIEAIWVNLMA